ncbi:hypothetical protein Golomagni_07432, partial [Golovinomyces magnicellulatus]
MGLHDTFRAVSVPERGLQIVNAAGKRCGLFPVTESNKGGSGFTSDYEIMRSDFCKLLYDACDPERVQFLFGNSIEKCEEGDDGVHVTFADGTEDTFDIVVGADGQWSKTRRLVFGEGGMQMVKGVCIAYFSMDQEKKPDEEYLATIYMANGGKGIMTRRHNAQKLQVYVGCSNDKAQSLKRGDISAEKKFMRDIFDGAGWRAPELMDAMDRSEDFYMERLGLVKLDKWSKGRVVLLGDAAYCPTALTGMGTSSAFIGAYVLAGELGECNGGKASIQNAFQRYEDKFRPFMQKTVKGVKTDSGGLFPESKLGVFLTEWGFRIASMLRLYVFSSLLHDKDIKWDVP